MSEQRTDTGIVVETRIRESMKGVQPLPILRISYTTRQIISKTNVVAHKGPTTVEGHSETISNNNRLDKMQLLQHNSPIALDSRCSHRCSSSQHRSALVKKESKTNKTRVTIGSCQLALDLALARPRKCR